MAMFDGTMLFCFLINRKNHFIGFSDFHEKLQRFTCCVYCVDLTLKFEVIFPGKIIKSTSGRGNRLISSKIPHFL